MNKKMLIGVIVICMIIAISSTSATYLFMNELNEKELAEQKDLYETDITNLAENLTSLINQVENLTEQLEEKEKTDYTTLDDGTIVTGDFDKIEFIDYLTSIENHSTADPMDDTYYVGGIVKNIGNKMFDDIVITVRYFNSFEEYLGYAQDSTKYLPPNTSWLFEITHEYIIELPGTKIKSFNIDHVSLDISVL